MREYKGVRIEIIVLIYLGISLGLSQLGIALGSKRLSAIGYAMMLPLMLLVAIGIILLPWSIVQSRRWRKK